MKKIERPLWLTNNVLTVTFYQWFDKHVEPVNRAIENAVDVYGNVYEPYKGEVNCSTFDVAKCNTNTHRALLINIQPIKKESAEDVLRDFVKEHIVYAWNHENRDMNYSLQKLQERAKAALADLEGAAGEEQGDE
jgi:hypothetical protein